MVPTKASFPAWREDGPPTHKSKLRLYHTQKQLIIYPLTLKENCLYFQSGPYLTRQETLQLRHIFRHDVFNGEWAISRMLCVPNPVFTAQEVYTRRRVRRMDVHMSIILFSYMVHINMQHKEKCKKTQAIGGSKRRPCILKNNPQLEI